ncbi:MAG TPA: DUF4192 family protein [Microbacterium sp.]|nr:DUF4192 family protein [Microbacterium sp.]
MTITLEHASAVRLLAGLPHQLGCSPRGSLVLVPVSGRATLGALRLDLPRDDDTDQIAELAIGYLERVPDAEDLVTTIWTDGPALDGAGVAYEALALAVAERAEAAGLRVAGEYCVGDDGWTSYGRPALRPLAELAEADPDPAAILARHPREGADVPRAEPADREEVARQLVALEELPTDPFRRLWEGPRPEAAVAEASAELRAFDADPLGCADEAFVGGDLEASRAALWMWILRCPALRDVMLTAWAGGTDEARRACEWQQEWVAGCAEPPDFPVRLAGEGSRPPAARLRAALAFSRALVARAPRTHIAACLAVCGWLSWALGNSTHAAEYAVRALEADERCTFAALIQTMTERGILPGWAFDPAGKDASELAGSFT